MHDLIELSAEVLGISGENTDGTSRQTHAVLCRPGDILPLVPVHAASPAGDVVAVLSARGDQLGQLPASTLGAAGPGLDYTSLSRKWRCQVVRVTRDDGRLRIILRLEPRGEAYDDEEIREIETLDATAAEFLTNRTAIGRKRDQMSRI